MLVISNHRLETVIAHGVTSEVWSAVRLGPGGFAQAVALKTLTPLHAASPAHVRAFLNEARATGHVHHPHVVQTHEVIEEDGRYWLSMELVRGWTLRALIATLRLTRRMLPLEVAVALIRDAAAAVHAIHDAGLLHRHITPDNLMASASGHAVVIDFGCAAWQLAEKVRFTAPLAEVDPTYASPQMHAQQRVDARTDVYSLGAVLHELIAGAPPPSPRGPRQIIVAPSSWRPDLPPALEGIIARALEHEPMVRFGSALELAQALEQVAIQHRWAVTPSHVTAYLAEIFKGADAADPWAMLPRVPDAPTTDNETDPFFRAVPAAPRSTDAGRAQLARGAPQPARAADRAAPRPVERAAPRAVDRAPDRQGDRPGDRPAARPAPDRAVPRRSDPTPPRPIAARPAPARPVAPPAAARSAPPVASPAQPLPRRPLPGLADPATPAHRPAAMPRPTERRAPIPPPFPRAAPPGPTTPFARAPAPAPIPRAPQRGPAPGDLASGSGARQMAAAQLAYRPAPREPELDADSSATTNPRDATHHGKTRVRVRRR